MNLKVFCILLFCLNPVFINISTGQRIYPEATLVYDVSVQREDSSARSGLEGASLTIYLKAFESRSDFKSAAGTESVLFDNKKGKGAILKEYSGQKLMITLTRENREKQLSYFTSLNFIEDSSRSSIGGFPVRLATAALPDNRKLLVYYSPGVIMQNAHYQFAFSSLKGLAVRFELVSGKETYVYQLRSISGEPLNPSLFVIPQNGFRIITYEENLALKN